MQPISHLPSSKPLHPQNSRQQISRQPSARGLYFIRKPFYCTENRQPTTDSLSAIGGFSERC